MKHPGHTYGGFVPAISERGMTPTDRSASVLSIVSGALFSGVVALSIAFHDFTKGCYTLTTLDTYGLGPYEDETWDVCGVLVRVPLQGVHRFESSRPSDMSNRLFVAASM
jgi:hypothetical protein